MRPGRLAAGLGLLLAFSGELRAADEAGRTVTLRGRRVEAVDPVRLPRSAAVMGSACSFRTSMAARAVMEGGEDYVFVGRLHRDRRGEVGGVACPFRLGGPDGACLIGNELVEYIDGQGIIAGELSIEGRMMQIDGIRFVVLTALEPEAG